MMNMIKRSFAFIFLVALVLNCESKNSDDEEKKRAIAGLLINSVTGNATIGSSSNSSSVGCSSTAPTFSTLAAAGVTSNCAKSGCHVGSSPQNGLDMSSYNSVITKVTAKNGSASLLYQKVNGGTMQQYTTSQITTAIYCWIQGGALP